MKKKLLSSSLILMMSVGISSAQLVTNGSFESTAGNTCDPNGAGCTPCFYCGTGTTFAGWTANDVDLFHSNVPGTNLPNGVPDGVYGLDLNGRGPGSISQVITGLTPGTMYTLAFKYSNNDASATCQQDKPFEVTLSDAATLTPLYSFILSTAGLSVVNNVWADFNQSAITPSSSIKIEFKSLFGSTSPAAPVPGCGFGGWNGGNFTVFGPVLDLVSVTPTTLPITLVSFGGTYSGSNLNLNWKTENEENVSKMVVQFYNGTSWQDIGSVNANGIGLSNNYSISIPSSAVNNIAQVNLRLKVVSLDNTISFSRIIGLNNSIGDIKLTLTPNPSKNGISFVRGLKGGETISVYNTLGQKFITKIATSTVETLDLSSFAKGIYNVSVVNKEGKIINNRLIKE
jgi:hypothetical protein